LAAQGELIHQDDTSVRILTLMQENQQIRAQAAAQGLWVCPTFYTWRFASFHAAHEAG
jgi:hypothetical protein